MGAEVEHRRDLLRRLPVDRAVDVDVAVGGERSRFFAASHSARNCATVIVCASAGCPTNDASRFALASRAASYVAKPPFFSCVRFVLPLLDFEHVLPGAVGAQASAAWQAAVCCDDAYAVSRLAAVRAV